MPKNKDRNPIFYNNAEEMDKPMSLLMEELRTEVAHIRGKLCDIRRSYGWKERIEHIEGALTCCLIAMHNTKEEWRKFEIKTKQEE